jgi:hypothetical protein
VQDKDNDMQRSPELTGARDCVKERNMVDCAGKPASPYLRSVGHCAGAASASPTVQ